MSSVHKVFHIIISVISLYLSKDEVIKGLLSIGIVDSRNLKRVTFTLNEWYPTGKIGKCKADLVEDRKYVRYWSKFLKIE